ncbi:MAG: hypothetical protein RR847_04670 [Bacilli bacterium]
MKLYHIDRLGTIESKEELNLNENIYLEDAACNKCLQLALNQSYKNGLSAHGIKYFFQNEFANSGAVPLSNMIDTIFEYERLLNYPDKLSRYQAFYAFDKEGIIKFINDKNLIIQYHKIYEVESKSYERHNMSLVAGDTHYNISAMAKCYWEDKEDPWNRIVQYEYLLEYPIKIIKEVKLNELK